MTNLVSCTHHLVLLQQGTAEKYYNNYIIIKILL